MTGRDKKKDRSEADPTEIPVDSPTEQRAVAKQTVEESSGGFSVDEPIDEQPAAHERTSEFVPAKERKKVSDTEPPDDVIGRYRVERLLGEGGFGKVYLAYDDELQRNVTIKIPHAHRISSSKEVDAFLSEARTLAKLEHPNVVPVHDVGHTDEGICFIVSRYIDGSDLHKRIKKSPLTIEESIALVATIAEALHYVHSMGVIHRDIKPTNILMDKRGTAYVADFGLALLEEDAARTSRVAGTPAYMSPEQARGENHLVTGRSDIFSLGIVLYQLITGSRPFAEKNSYLVLRMIQEQEAQPPTEVNPEVSPELERICLKALSKRTSARHDTALELANDLRCLLTNPQQAAGAAAEGDAAKPDSPESQLAGYEREGSQAKRRATGLIPRGLRSFGSQDAHFFTELLPGPYGRTGVPESILFWKRRIEERDPENTFRVGLIYGPSGCGKSSFCKAGLVPTLEKDVLPIFVEAAPEATETRLINRIRRNCPYLDTDLDLRESIAALRHHNVTGRGTKVLLIIDQFEQWLYSTEQPEHSEMAKALRQCDGEHVQCILLVRDDFWLAFSRFMEHIEIDLRQNHNMAMIDLFDLEHAKLVLREFGRAFGRLPKNTADLSRDERAFVTQAIGGLAENGKVIPVRIALFAEMIKSRPWTTATLKQIGGTKGVGVMFLEENFSSSNAPAQYAVHLNAVYETLGALLPQPGANLKGHMRSRDELLADSGYADQPKQFESLIRTLDNELHLITRTTPGGRGDRSTSGQSGSFSDLQSADGMHGEFFQLAHDYLVPAIREWQVRMQRESARGRAEIRLRQRAEVWSARPETRHLPTITEWMSVHAFTSKSRWSESERDMMRSAGRRHGLTLIAVVMMLALGAFALRQFSRWNNTNARTGQLLVAEVSELDGLLDDFEAIGPWGVDRLKSIQQSNEPGSSKHLFSTLALLRIGAKHRQVDVTAELNAVKPSLLHADAETLRLICREVEPYREDIAAYLWSQVEEESSERATNELGRSYHPQLNALMALATLDPPGTSDENRLRWQEYAPFTTNELVHFANIDRSNFPPMVELVRPAVDVLMEPLESAMIDPDADGGTLTQSAAQNLLLSLLKDRVPDYVDILLSAEVDQVLASIDLIDSNATEIRQVLDAAIVEPVSLSDENWIRTASRKATAAALLLRHGVTTPEVWSVLVPDRVATMQTAIPEERLRSELKRLLPARIWDTLDEQGDVNAMTQRYQEETFGRTTIPNARTRLVQRLRTFKADPIAIARKLIVEQELNLQCGLIQALGEFEPGQIEPSLREQVITLAKGWMLSADSARLRGNAYRFLMQWSESEWAKQQFVTPSRLRSEEADWYVNSIGLTMIELPQHEVNDRYRIEMAANETTLGQLKIWKENGEDEYKWSGEQDVFAAGNVKYHDCVAFCNWLSRKEGLDDDDLCYPDRTDPNGPAVQIYPDYRKRKGYRLPMAEEWFFAFSAGAITDYSFGSGLGGPGPLVDQLYEGYVPRLPTGGKQTWQVGVARPNDFGLFDMHLNVREWANNVDSQDSSRFQLCGFDYRFHLGMRGVEPRYLGWSAPDSSRSFYGFRIVRSKPK
ncbi:MAG: protein kinase [Planctomycetota bacterium]